MILEVDLFSNVDYISSISCKSESDNIFEIELDS